MTPESIFMFRLLSKVKASSISFPILMDLLRFVFSGLGSVNDSIQPEVVAQTSSVLLTVFQHWARHLSDVNVCGGYVAGQFLCNLIM